jgi:hypothetical protein
MTTTPNLGLTTYNTASGSAVTFLTYRLAVGGNSSNMTLIDTFAGDVNGSIVSLQSNMLIGVQATMITPNVYEATVSSIDSYLTNSMIALELNVANTGTTTLNINSLGAITLKKIDYLGNLVNIGSGDLKANRWTLFFYNGTYYVLMGTTTADQISISGKENNFLSISGSGTIQNSGVSASSLTVGIFETTTQTGSYILLASDCICLASGSITIILPEAIGILGKTYTIKNISGSGSGSIVIIHADGLSLIESGSEITLGDLESARFVSDNIDWWKV